MIKLVKSLLVVAAVVAAVLSAHAQTGTAQSKSSLSTEINTQFQDNTSGAITPFKLRQVTQDMLSSWQQYLAVNKQTGGSYTIQASDYGQLVLFSNAGAIAVTLPGAATLNPFNTYLSASGGTVTITPSGGQTIGGAASLVLLNGQSAQIASDGVNWQIVQSNTGSGSGTSLTVNSTPVAGGDTTSCLGVSAGGKLANVGCPNVYNPVDAGWTCTSTDQSTAAQALLTTVANAGGGTIAFPPCAVATFTATAAGTNLTVSAVSKGTIVIGSILAGNGVPPNGNSGPAPRVTITSQSSGTPGGAGVYVTSAATTASADQLLAQPCYRADSQLTIPLYPTTTANAPTSAPIRLTGAGAGSGLGGNDIGLNANDNAACLDLRYKTVNMSGAGVTIASGSGYTSGTAQQTLTLSGGAGPIATLGTITGGSGGTPATYTGVWLQGTNGGANATGSGAKATITVGAGGNVTAVSITTNGTGYSIGDVLSVNSVVGPAGIPTNFSVPVATVTSSFTCSVAPQWQVVVSGGAVQAGNQAGVAPSGTFSSIGVTRAGSCSVVPQNPVTVTSSDSGTGATFNVYWTGGKIQSLGTGALQIDHLDLVDGNSSANSAAMVYTTNSVLEAYDNDIDCSSDPNQDAFVLGGLLGSGHVIPPNDTADSPMIGFGSRIDHNVTNGCNRLVFARTFNAMTTVTNNIANGGCAGDRFMEFMSARFNVLYPYVANNYTEDCPSLRYGIVLNEVNGGSFINNSTVDINFIATYQYDYYYQDIFGGGGVNTFILSQGCINQVSSLPLCQTFNNGSPSLSSSNIIGRMAGALNMAQQGNQGNTVAAWFLNPLASGQNWNTGLCPQGAFTALGGAAGDMITMGPYPALQSAAIDAQTASTCAAVSLVLNPNGGFVALQSYANDTSTGTGNGLLAKFTTDNPSKIITMATTDIAGAMGIVVGGGGASGSAAAVSIGEAWCFFDNTAAASDYVQISNTTAGKCHDAGATLPTSGQIIGQAIANGSGLQKLFVSLQTALPSQVLTNLTASIAGFTTMTVANTTTLASLTLTSTPTLPASTTGAGTQTFTNSPCSGLTSEKWIGVQIKGQTGNWFIPACQ